MTYKKLISIIIPTYNEDKTITKLVLKTISVLNANHIQKYEFIIINDGSTDKTLDKIKKLKKISKNIKIINFPYNQGKTIALNKGFQQSKGEIVFTMDADLQDDPQEIPRFIQKIESGYDLVSGWKKNRHDPISKTIPSFIFNKTIQTIFELKIHDINCGFKAYRKKVVKSLNLYGEQHRFIPIIAKGMGYSISEIIVKHHKRKYGKSKYGFSRFFKGLLDVLTILVLTKYAKRPAHFFGGAGIILGLSGISILLYLSILWFFNIRPIDNRPLFFLGILSLIISIQLISLGVLAELIISSNNNPINSKKKSI